MWLKLVLSLRSSCLGLLSVKVRSMCPSAGLVFVESIFLMCLISRVQMTSLKSDTVQVKECSPKLVALEGRTRFSLVLQDFNLLPKEC